LQSVVTSGTASGKIGLADKCEVAGKTGTTQNNCDKYFIGYTPDILAGVWFGYEYPRSLHEFGGNFSITVWDELMQKIYSLGDNNNFKSKFIVPDSVGKLTYNVKTGNPPTANESPDEWEDGWFLQQNK
jgi:membrane carboxypeptidase/penicillin-binding protein